MILVSASSSPLWHNESAGDLHKLTLLASTSCVTSFVILDFALGDMVVNHLASLTLPCREMSKIQLTCLQNKRID